jgi:hypothetical protein
MLPPAAILRTIDQEVVLSISVILPQDREFTVITKVPALCKENTGFGACSYPVRPCGAALG